MSDCPGRRYQLLWMLGTKVRAAASNRLPVTVSLVLGLLPPISLPFLQIVLIVHTIQVIHTIGKLATGHSLPGVTDCLPFQELRRDTLKRLEMKVTILFHLYGID